MIGLAAWYAVIALMAGVLTLCLLRRDGWRAWAAAGMLALLYVVMPVAMTRTLGRPLPLWAHYGRLPDWMEVLWFGLDVGRSIRVLLNADPPLYLELPWSLSSAEALYEADEQRIRMGRGTRLMVSRRIFEPSLETREPLAYPEPPAAPPPKGDEDE